MWDVFSSPKFYTKMVGVVTVAALLFAVSGAQNGTRSHPCHRQCRDDQPPMKCEYNFTVEWFRTMSKTKQIEPVSVASTPFCPAVEHGDGQSSVNRDNLIRVPIVSTFPDQKPDGLKVASFNAQSVGPNCKEKRTEISSFILENGIDIMFVVETWLKARGDEAACADLTLSRFNISLKACWDCPFNVTDCFRPHCVTGDGKSRLIMTVNRQIPGPPIEVCGGDTVVAWVRNNLEDGSSTSMHWHGMHMRGTPYMDGAVHVTQCPINPLEVFRYEFKADPAGTYYYHSHTGAQIGDGVYGALIVRQTPEAEVNIGLYDRDLSDHVVQIGDWLPLPSFDRFTELQDSYRFLQWSAIINGRGRLYRVPNTYNTSGSPLSSAMTPFSVFHVTNGTRYRFRLINVAQKCPFRVFVEQHTMMILTSDGEPVFPVTVESILMGPGERFDVVINADKPVDNYWIRAVGLGECFVSNGTTAAILKYEGATDEEPQGDYRVYPNGTMFGPMRGMKEQVYLGDEVIDPEIKLPNVLLTDLNSQGPNPVNYTNRPPDVTHYLGVGFLSNDNSYYNHPEYYPIHSLRPQNSHSSSIVNYITFALPSVPLLSQPEDVDTSIFCNRSTFKNLTQCQEKLCRCTHRIHVQLGQEVELVVAVVSPYGAGHPMHLHGYKFHVLAMEPYGPPYDIEHVEKQDKESPFVRKFFKPPFKDTVIIPNHHYAVLRFKADNPGVWFFHCHIASHMIAGQGLVIQVGDPSQWPPLPANFPRCGGHGVAYPAPGERKPCTGTASSHSSIGAAILLSLICLCSLALKMN